MSQPDNDLQQCRTSLIGSGILFLLVGFAGLFFGINLVMKGAAQFALGLAPRGATAAAA